MKSKNYNKLESLIYNARDDKSFLELINQFGGVNYLSESVAKQIEKTRVEYLEIQPGLFFEHLGIRGKGKDVFIFQEMLLIRSMLLPIYRIKRIEYLNKTEKDELVTFFEEGLAELSAVTYWYEKQLIYNFENELPATVSNLISHFSQLFEYIIAQCAGYALDFSECLYNKILDDWLGSIRKEYSTERLFQQLEIIKAGPHSLARVLAIQRTFPELFKRDEEYQHIRKILAEQKLINESTGVWMDRKNGYIGVLISIIKKLKEEGYFSPNVLTCNKEIASVMINSFQVKASESFIARVNPDNFNVSFIPIRKDLKKAA